MTKESEITIVPLRVGIRFSPPALVYIYEKKVLDMENRCVLRQRIMPVRDFFQSSDIKSTAESLMERHGTQLFSDVPIQIVCKMLRLLREHKNGVDLKTALEIVDEEANELKGINDMLKKTDDSYKRAISSRDSGHSIEREDASKLPEEKGEAQDLDAENTWDDDDGEYSLEFPVDKTVT